MRRLYRILFLFLIGLNTSFSSISQNIEEDVYLHINSTTVLAGETIHYSAYVFSKKTGKPSPLSKILYVELINDRGKVAYQSKILLKEGRGSGDIFITSTFETSAYQLIAYTRWMKNFKSCFESPIMIINPFKTVETPVDSLANWNMDFHTSKVGIVKGIKNKIYYSVRSAGDETLNFSGKIIDSKGNKLIDFKPIVNGKGSFEIVPKSDQKHQAVLEDNDGNFHFFDLPNIEEQGSLIYVNNGNVAVQVNVLSSFPDFEGKIIVKDQSGIILSRNVVNNSVIPIPKRDFRLPITQFHLYDIEDNLIDTQIHYSSPDASLTSGNIKTKVYGKREDIQLNIEAPEGTYSISIRAKNTWLKDYRISSKNYIGLVANIDQYQQQPDILNEENLGNEEVMNIMIGMLEPKANQMGKVMSAEYLPEFRGELIEGQVFDQSGKPLTQAPVAFSNLGNNQLSFAKSDANGKFTINAFPSPNDIPAYISILDQSDYQIRFKDNFMKEKPGFIAPEIHLDSTTITKISQASVNVQIENAYFTDKKEKQENIHLFPESFSQYDFHYELDDYNRFKTLKETFVEYVIPIAPRTKKGKEVLKVRTGEYNPDFNEAPLLLLDGIPVDTDDLMKFSPYRVKSIDIIANRVYFGPLIFDGVISLKTFKGDLHEFEVDESSLKFTMKGLEPKKEYHYPEYATHEFSRLPDRRTQLYWSPISESYQGKLPLNFSTSDVAGKYEIHVEGFTKEGEPFSSVKTFEVE